VADADDPLFDASSLAVDVDPSVVEEVHGWLPEREEVDVSDLFWGRRVGWAGTQGRMLKLPWDQITASPGNPFDPEKVSAFRDLILSGERPIFYAPPARLMRVGLDDVAESLAAEREGELFESLGTSRPYTTGDDELDEFLADPEDYLDTYAEDEDEAETIRAHMTVLAEEAIDEQSGDLGKLVAYLRDGNHRAFGAQLANEDEIWVTIRFDEPEADMQRLGLRPEDFE